MIIIIGGLAGVGTTVLSRALKSVLPTYEVYSSGNTFRQIAHEWSEKNNLGLSAKEALMKYEELAKKDMSIDRNLDKSVEKFAEEHPDCIIESRLAWYFVPRVVEHFNADGKRNLLSFLVTCGDRERFRRISIREECTEDEAKTRTVLREAAIAERYPKVHQIQFSEIVDPNNFHHTLNSEWLTLEEEVATVMFHLGRNSPRH